MTLPCMEKLRTLSGAIITEETEELTEMPAHRKVGMACQPKPNSEL